MIGIGARGGVPNEVVDQIRGEVLSPKAEAVLEKAFFAAGDPDVEWEISRQMQTIFRSCSS